VSLVPSPPVPQPLLTLRRSPSRALVPLSGALLLVTLAGVGAGWQAWRDRQEVLRTSLEAALHYGDLGGATALIRQGADPRTAVFRGTAVHLAAHRKDHAAMRWLLDIGAPAEVVTRTFPPASATTPLMIAAQHADPVAAELLLEHRADPNARDDGGRTVLEIALCGGSPRGNIGNPHAERISRKLLDQGAIGTGAALHAAVGWYPRLVPVLLERGADPEARNSCGMTPLMSACLEGEPRSVRTLLGAHVDLNARDATGRTAIQFALERCAVECTQLLRRAGARSGDTRSAALIGVLADAARGVPRFTSVERRRYCAELLRNGADPNATDLDKSSALMLAVWSGDATLVRLLIRAGAAINYQNDGGTSALNAAAATSGRGDVIRLLVRSGAQLRASRAVLVDAVVGGLENVRALIDCGAPVNQQDSSGETALMRASQLGELETVKVLLNAGARVDIRNMHGLSPLAFVQYNGGDFPKIRGLLLAAKSRQSRRQRSFSGRNAS
jgi:uncharacterized protein